MWKDGSAPPHLARAPSRTRVVVHQEAVMTTSHGVRLVTLSWQTWSVVVVVLALVLLAGGWALTW